jgi:hypothetical protein
MNTEEYYRERMAKAMVINSQTNRNYEKYSSPKKEDLCSFKGITLEFQDNGKARQYGR